MQLRLTETFFLLFWWVLLLICYECTAGWNLEDDEACRQRFGDNRWHLEGTSLRFAYGE
jgi:hypothetical protein